MSIRTMTSRMKVSQLIIFAMILFIFIIDFIASVATLNWNSSTNQLYYQARASPPLMMTLSSKFIQIYQQLISCVVQIFRKLNVWQLNATISQGRVLNTKRIMLIANTCWTWCNAKKITFPSWVLWQCTLQEKIKMFWVHSPFNPLCYTPTCSLSPGSQLVTHVHPYVRLPSCWDFCRLFSCWGILTKVAQRMCR